MNNNVVDNDNNDDERHNKNYCDSDGNEDNSKIKNEFAKFDNKLKRNLLN